MLHDRSEGGSIDACAVFELCVSPQNIKLNQSERERELGFRVERNLASSKMQQPVNKYTHTELEAWIRSDPDTGA